MSAEKYQGSCLCGQVRYQVAKLEPGIGHCHCTMCRKFHGAAFATYSCVKFANFTWLSGEGLLQDYIAPNGTTRRFCSVCGSSMVFRPGNSDDDIIELSLATLDTDIEERPDAHIFLANKANWYDLTDQLTQHTAARPQAADNEE